MIFNLNEYLIKVDNLTISETVNEIKKHLLYIGLNQIDNITFTSVDYILHVLDTDDIYIYTNTTTTDLVRAYDAKHFLSSLLFYEWNNKLNLKRCKDNLVLLFHRYK